jgi:hypothetical protein
MIGSKKGASEAVASPTPATTSTTGTSSEVAHRGITSLTHKTTTIPSSASTARACTGGRRSASTSDPSAETSGRSSSRPSGRTRVTSRSSSARVTGSPSRIAEIRPSIVASTGNPPGKATAIAVPSASPSPVKISVDPTSATASTTRTSRYQSRIVPRPSGHGSGPTRNMAVAAPTAASTTGQRRRGRAGPSGSSLATAGARGAASITPVSILPTLATRIPRYGGWKARDHRA